MKGKIINIVLILTAVLLLAVFAFAVRIRPAADHVAVLKTAGMTCGGCSTSIEKALQSARGVAAVEVDVGAGRVVVAYDSRAVKPEALAATDRKPSARLRELIVKEARRRFGDGPV